MVAPYGARRHCPTASSPAARAMSANDATNQHHQLLPCDARVVLLRPPRRRPSSPRPAAAQRRFLVPPGPCRSSESLAGSQPRRRPRPTCRTFSSPSTPSSPSPSPSPAALTPRPAVSPVRLPLFLLRTGLTCSMRHRAPTRSRTAPRPPSVVPCTIPPLLAPLAAAASASCAVAPRWSCRCPWPRAVSAPSARHHSCSLLGRAPPSPATLPRTGRVAPLRPVPDPSPSAR